VDQLTALHRWLEEQEQPPFAELTIVSNLLRDMARRRSSVQSAGSPEIGSGSPA
jgi:hypothetical protein